MCRAAGPVNILSDIPVGMAVPRIKELAECAVLLPERPGRTGRTGAVMAERLITGQLPSQAFRSNSGTRGLIGIKKLPVIQSTDDHCRW